MYSLVLWCLLTLVNMVIVCCCMTTCVCMQTAERRHQSTMVQLQKTHCLRFGTVVLMVILLISPSAEVVQVMVQCVCSCRLNSAVFVSAEKDQDT